MCQFVRMYEPHEAREDTVLFPAIRSIVSAHESGALGEEFEKEHQLFGEEGFETLGGIPGVLVAGLVVQSLPLTVLRWVVVFVVFYAGTMMLRLRAGVTGRLPSADRTEST